MRWGSSLDYPDSVRWQHLLALYYCLGKLCSAFVTVRAASPQNMIKTLVRSQAEFEIKLNKDILLIRYHYNKKNCYFVFNFFIFYFLFCI